MRLGILHHKSRYKSTHVDKLTKESLGWCPSHCSFYSNGWTQRIQEDEVCDTEKLFFALNESAH